MFASPGASPDWVNISPLAPSFSWLSTSESGVRLMQQTCIPRLLGTVYLSDSADTSSSDQLAVNNEDVANYNNTNRVWRKPNICVGMSFWKPMTAKMENRVPGKPPTMSLSKLILGFTAVAGSIIQQSTVCLNSIQTACNPTCVRKQLQHNSLLTVP